MDERQIDVDGQRIAYVQSDGEGASVIFVYGNSSSARTLAAGDGWAVRAALVPLPGL